MADIASNMTFTQWLHAKLFNIMDVSDDVLYATMLGRGIKDDEALFSDTDEKQRDLCLADLYVAAAVSSVKSGTQGEADGGWTHYVAIKNVVSRDALMQMAKDLYAKWGEPFTDPTPKIRMKPLYK